MYEVNASTAPVFAASKTLTFTDIIEQVSIKCSSVSMCQRKDIKLYSATRNLVSMYTSVGTGTFNQCAQKSMFVGARSKRVPICFTHYKLFTIELFAIKKYHQRHTRQKRQRSLSA